MTRKDELLDRQSGLTVISGLDFLREKAYSSFEQIFYDLEEKTGGIVTVQTASKIAVEIVTGLISPIAQQIDPLHVGEAARALRVAEQYGSRLAAVAKSIERQSLLRLLTGYASHGFVIDRREASQIFKNVRDATALETELAESLGSNARRPLASARSRPHFEYVSDEMVTAGVRHEQRTEKAGPGRTNARLSGVQHARTGKGAGSGSSTGSSGNRRGNAHSKRAPAARKSPGRARLGNGLSPN